MNHLVMQTKYTVRANSRQTEIYMEDRWQTEYMRKALATCGGKVFVVTDLRVAKYHASFFTSVFAKDPDFVLKGGEACKNFTSLKAILAKMHELGVTRDYTLVAVGGGVVGDIAALAASLYMRGVDLIQIPTTLLAQVDSSIGGKTAVDFCGIKNLVGTFCQPKYILINGRFLETLDKKQYRCGIGEIIKYSALCPEIYDITLKYKNRARFYYSTMYLEKAIPLCIKFKADIVEEDEEDLYGLRAQLNLGHTTAHAIELFYPRLNHGECVLTGLYYEAQIAFRRGICEGQFCKDFCDIIKSIINVPALEDTKVVAKSALSDKKNKEDKIILCVPKTVGEYDFISLSEEEYANELEIIKRGILNG